MDTTRSRTVIVAVCCALLIAALCTTLTNTSQFASMFEPGPMLSWAFAVFVDVALIAYTIARAWLRAHGMRANAVRYGFWFFLALSTIANVLVSSDRLLDGALTRVAVGMPWFVRVYGVVYGMAIPVAVFVFAETIVDMLALPKAPAAHAHAPRAQAGARDVAQAVRKATRVEPDASDRRIAEIAGVSASSVHKYRTRSRAEAARDGGNHAG